MKGQFWYQFLQKTGFLSNARFHHILSLWAACTFWCQALNLQKTCGDSESPWNDFGDYCHTAKKVHCSNLLSRWEHSLVPPVSSEHQDALCRVNGAFSNAVHTFCRYIWGFLSKQIISHSPIISYLSSSSWVMLSVLRDSLEILNTNSVLRVHLLVKEHIWFCANNMTTLSWVVIWLRF